MAAERNARTRELMLALALALAAAPGPALAGGGAAIPAPFGGQGKFAAPAGPMILTREVRRSLADGQVFVSRRRYAVRFVPAGVGYQVEGTLVDSTVEGPPGIMKLAELERTREGGPFPILLDSSGRIVAQQDAESPSQAERTLAAARRALGDAGLSADERDAGLAAVAAIQARAAAGRAIWPADLFHPAPGSHSEERALQTELGSGQVRISTSADTNPDGVLSRFTRQVTTDLGGSSRANTESWTLAPAP